MRVLIPALLIFISTELIAVEPTRLQMPDLRDENIISTKVGLRPLRTKGIRIEIEPLFDKNVIHNYGHGGAGISLSFGSVQESIRLMEEMAPSKDETIAILGAGVIGLATANQLLERGYRVSIYSSEFSPFTTSEVAAGLWDVYGVEKGEDTKRAERMNTASYDYFAGLAQALFPGISFVDAYLFGWPQDAFQNRSDVSFKDVVWSDGRAMHSSYQRMIIIETPSYIKHLNDTATALGADFIERDFQAATDLESLEEKTVFNCLGLGAAKVFNDPFLVPVRGQLIQFKKQDGIVYVAAIKPSIANTYICLFPYRDSYILGGSYEVGEDSLAPTSEIRDAILAQAREFFKPRRSDEL
jgi:D-amino-acid oxidase